MLKVYVPEEKLKPLQNMGTTLQWIICYGVRDRKVRGCYWVLEHGFSKKPNAELMFKKMDQYRGRAIINVELEGNVNVKFIGPDGKEVPT